MYRLLYLAPQPRDAGVVNNRQDIQSIGYRLTQLNLPNLLEVHEQPNPRFADLPFWLERLTPQLVHFSGHGTQLSKLLFVDDKGGRHDVPADAVASLFAAQTAKNRVKGVVLNTCYSLPVAEQIVKSVDFVVSTATEIQDESAIRFAETFYPFLLKGTSLLGAFNQGLTQVLANRRGTQEPPRLLVRPGLDPEKYTLAEPGEAPPPPRPPFIYVLHCASCAEDERMAQELCTMLRGQRLAFFDITQIRGGQRRSDVIAEALSRATQVVALISPDAQADNEWFDLLEKVLRQAGSTKTTIVPVRLRPSLPTPVLKDFELFPRGSKAVSQWKSRDEIWVKLVTMLCDPAAKSP